MMSKLLELIKEILKDQPETIKYLLTNDESNFNSSFILRLCEKIIYYFPQNKKNSNIDNSTVQNLNLSKIQDNTTNTTGTNLNNNFSQYLLNQIADDIKNLFKLINLNIVQYIFSPLMPYFYLENKAFEHFFRNLSIYSTIMKKGYICKDNNNFLNLSLNKFGLIPINTFDTNYLNLSIDRKISFNISNETLAELIVYIPSILEHFKKSNYVCSGELYDDLKASYMDLYENYIKLKKDFFYIYKTDNENFDVDDETLFDDEDFNSRLNELVYIEKTKYKMEKKKNKNLKLSIKLNSLSINIFDKIFFISTGICSKLNISLKDLLINNEELKEFPISKNYKINLQYNPNTFNPYLILTLFNQTSIKIQKISATIDMIEPLLETDLNIDIITTLWDNIHFLPNLLIDIYSNKILINIVPGIIKVINLFENLNHFQTLYKKSYGIINISKLKLNEIKEPNIKTANITQIISYINDIKKVFDYDENIFPLKYYFINRTSQIINYSVGKEKDDKNGIIIKLSCDNLNTINDVEDIVGIQIPLLLFNSKKTLFYEGIEIWMSDIQIMESKNKFLEKLKISFPNESYNSNLFEYLFSEKFCFSTGIVNKMEANNSNIKFEEPKNLFEKRKILLNGLNRVLSRTTYYYEDTDLKKIYNDIFYETAVKSQIIININKISLIVVMQNNQNTFSFLNKFILYKNMCSNQLDVMQELNDTSQDNNKNERKKVNNQTHNLKAKTFDIDNENNNNNNFHISINHESNDISNEEQINNPTINFKRLSPHIIDCSINKISIKLTETEDKKLKDKGAFIFINKIKYNEKKDISVEDEKVKNLIEVESIKVFACVPNIIHNLEDYKKKGSFESKGIVELIDSKKMEIILEELSKQKNNILCLLIEDIKLIQNIERTVIFQILKTFQLGLIDRIEREKINNETIVNFKEKILSIYNLEDYNSINEENKNAFFPPINDKPVNILNILSSDNFKTKCCLEVFIKKENLNGNLLNSNRRGFVNLKGDFVSSEQKEFKLFAEMFKMIKIIIEGIKLNPKYSTEINLGFIYFKFISSIFRYIYFIRNYIRDETQIFKKAFEKYENEIKEDIIIQEKEEEDEINTSVKYKKQKSSIGIHKLNLEDEEEENNRYSKEQNINKLYSRQKSLMKTKKKNKVYEQKSSLASKNTPLITLSIPFFIVCFEQVENNILKPFIYFIINNIEGELNINEKNIKDFPLNLTVKEIILKGDTRCENLVKCDSNFNALTTTIFLSREINSYEEKVNVTLNHIKFIFIFKVIKELLLFFEINSACLDENPKKETINDLLLRKRIEEMLLMIKGNNISIIIPEDSQSANYLCLNAEKIQVKIKKIDLSPRIIISHNKDNDPNPLIIDEKTIYNIHSIETLESIPHTLVDVIGKTINGFFCINKKKEKLADIEQINITINQPANDHEITLMRKKLWKEQHNNSEIVTYKPSLNISLQGNINSFLGNLLSLKIFVDSNFDEESNIKILSERSSNFDLMEFKLNLNDLNINLEMYKCYQDILEDIKIEKIEKVLPGKQDEILFGDKVEDEVKEDIQSNNKMVIEDIENEEETYSKKISKEKKIDSLRSHYTQERDLIKETEEENLSNNSGENKLYFNDSISSQSDK